MKKPIALGLTLALAIVCASQARAQNEPSPPATPAPQSQPETTAPAQTLKTEELQQLVKPLRDRPVTICLLDIGGDKPLPFLRMPVSSNPVLGRRGVRILLEYSQLVRTQLGAILRGADAVVDSITTARHELWMERVGEAEARSEIVGIGIEWRAVILIRKHQPAS